MGNRKEMNFKQIKLLLIQWEEIAIKYELRDQKF